MAADFPAGQPSFSKVIAISERVMGKQFVLVSQTRRKS
jgi:hypothetical protein